MNRNAKWLAAFFGLTIATAAMALTVNGELKKALLEKLAADPTAYEGRVYYNTVSQKARIYDGSSWSDIGGATSSLNEYLMEVGNASNSRATFNSSLLGDAQASSVSATATITIASPGVVTITGHGLTTGKKIYFTTTGALPTGLTASTTYYVIFVDANTFRLATSAANALAGTAINTSGSQSGVHTAFYGGISLNSTLTGSKTFAEFITIGTNSTPTGELEIRKASSTRPALNMYKGGTVHLTLGVNSVANDLSPSTGANDVVIRSQNSSSIAFTADGGITTHAKINSDGSAYLGLVDSNINIGGYFIGSAAIAAGGDCTTSPCTISAENGDMINTVTRSAAGTYTVNFTPSFWASPGPTCVANSIRGGSIFCVINASGLSTSSYGVSCYSDTGTLTDGRFSMICHGKR